VAIDVWAYTTLFCKADSREVGCATKEDHGTGCEDEREWAVYG